MTRVLRFRQQDSALLLLLPPRAAVLVTPSQEINQRDG